MPEHSRWAPRRRGLAYLILCAVLAAASGAGCLLAPAGSHFRSYLGGLAAGLGATTAVFLVLVVLDRRGHDSVFSREILGRNDERDKMVWLRAWSLTGVIGLVSAMIAVTAAVLVGVDGVAALTGMEVLMAMTLIGGKIYYDRAL